MAEKLYPIINNFSKGELSPRIEGRIDLPGYYQGCKTMENAIMVAQGGAEKRPGTVYIGEAAGGARLIPFEVSDTKKFILEVSATRIVPWDISTETPGTAIDINYGNTDISEIQTAQAENSLYFAHEDHPVSVLTYAGDSFSWRPANIDVDPWEGQDFLYGDYTFYQGVYYKCINAHSDQTPGSGSWEAAGQGPSNLSGDVLPWSSSPIYNLGDYVIKDEQLWRAIKGSNQGKVPGVDTSTTTNEWIYGVRVEDIWILSTVPWGTTPDRGVDDINAIKVYLASLYGEGNYTLRSKYFWNTAKNRRKHPTSGYTLLKLYHIEYDYQTSVTEYTTWWESVRTFPDILTSLFSGIGSYSINDYAYDATTFGVFRSTSNSNTTAPATTSYWEVQSNPLLNGENDYPSVVAFAEQRLYLAGTKTNPQTIMASKIGQYDNFSIGTDDDDAFSFTIASERSSRIKWIVAKDGVMVGTTEGEWLITGTEAGITPTSVRIAKQSAYGSAYRQASYIADTLVFFQKGGRKLREYIYSNDNKAYLANDLTFFADHITQSTIRDIAYQYNPDSILWAVKYDGTLIGLTYNRANQISGWHKHTTAGVFESIASIEGPGDEDQLWVIVNRVVNGSRVRYLEKIAPRLLPTQTELIFSDSAATSTAGARFIVSHIVRTATKTTVTFVGTADFGNGDTIRIDFSGEESIDRTPFTVSNLSGQTFDLVKDGSAYVPGAFTDPEQGTMYKVATVFEGFTHLIGETVAVLGDGAVFPPVVVDSSGQITIASVAHTVVAGLPYVMDLTPESVEIPGNVTLGAKRRISKVSLRLYRTLGGKAGADEGTLQEIRFRSTEVPFGSPPELYTGMIDLPIDDSSGQEQSVVLLHDQPLPFTVLAIIYDITYSR